MWIVRLALRRPYTVAVFCSLIMLLGVLALQRMITDVLPIVDIPAVVVVWNYPGLGAEDMERRVTLVAERAYSTTVSGISRIESNSIQGIGLLRVYFQPGTDVGGAIAQMSSVSSAILRILPPGITPPAVIQYNAANVPVAQLTLSSDTLSEDKIFDYGLNFIRISLFTIPGLATPAPFGGRNRQINVDIDPAVIAGYGVSTADVVTALQNSNVILPAGIARMGRTEYNVFSNSSPSLLEEFRDIPIRVVGTAPVRLGDVARISDSYADQTNIVRVNGRRATYLAVLRKSDASTLAVVDATRAALPSIRAAAPEGLEIRMDFDQSVFVRTAVKGVVSEGLIAMALVGTMILLFLGSWRSVFIVCTSIPLSLMVSILGLFATGNSLNIMTLSGLSLAIGMLVDDATVEIENIQRNRGMGKPITVAILDGAHQVAQPAIVATLSICIVFFPVALLEGPSRFLFQPLALAVVFAMLTSYVLSRTLVPTLSRMLLPGELGHVHGCKDPEHQPKTALGRFSVRYNEHREHALDKLRDAYGGVLSVVLAHRGLAILVALVVLAASAALPFVVGFDFFPTVDAGIMKLHMRAPGGLRIEDTEQEVAQVENEIRRVIPAGELQTINDMIGVPLYYNLAFVPTDNAAGTDADILIQLKPGHRPSADYMRALRRSLPDRFPGTDFYFQPADIVTQVIDFGLSAPIDVQIQGMDLNRSHEIAVRLRDELKLIPGAVDVHIVQFLEYPAYQVDVDRLRAGELGLSQRDVAVSMLVGLSTSILFAPSFYLNPQNNVNYNVVVHVPLPRVSSVQEMANLPLTGAAGAVLLSPADAPPPSAQPSAPSTALGNVSRIYQRTSPAMISHYTVQRVVDVAASVEGRDLGAVNADIARVIARLGPLPRGMKITLRGQGETMNTSFGALGTGLILAVLLVYLLMVVLFQSWLDPFIIIMAVPGALVGILWMLAITGTTLNVVSLMGSIMAIGIAVSNSILMVSFANEIRAEQGLSPVEGALEAGRTRLRPVLMTALAMILGMIPMSLGLGEGGEQNAPLARAVIGGLIIATIGTLFLVPTIYSLLRRKAPAADRLDRKFAAESKGETYVEGAK